MVSSADGQHYYQTDPRRTAVIKYAYATGEVGGYPVKTWLLPGGSI